MPSLDANSGGFSPVGGVLSTPDPLQLPLLRVRQPGMCRQAMSLRLLLVSDVASVSDGGRQGGEEKRLGGGRGTGKNC